MHKFKLVSKFLIIILSFSFSNVFALHWHQKITVNNNKSGEVRLIYSTANSEINANGFFNSIPFADDKIRATYTSDNNTIHSVNVRKSSDSTFANVLIKFKDIQQLITASGFSKAKITWYKNEDSTVFMYNQDKTTDFQSGSKISFVFELPSTEILRTSGIKDNDNTVMYGVKSENMANGPVFYVVFKNSEESKNSASDNDESYNEKESGRCGLFGIEMPIIFGFSMLLLRIRFKK
ncbi:MAG: hypothetical protein IPM96_10425 [Ignavibacteria bacterium]|nr:hypothetical protein [Ignavibacteria bacterium]